MKAAYSEENGGPEQVRVGELPTPEPASNELLLRNHAAGVGPWDWKALAGTWRALTFPHIPGVEVAGVVERAAEGSEFKVGDEVWGRARGAYAEYLVTDGSNLVPKPANLTFEDAASLVITGSTAHEGIIDRLKVQPGETIIVTAASGGVGSTAVQIASSTGATVIGVCSATNIDYVRSLGAACAFDYDDKGWVDALLKAVPGGADALFDGAGRETGQSALRALKDGGRGAFIAYPNPDVAAEGRGIIGEGFSAASKHDVFVALNQLVESGKLRPQVSSILPLDQAGEALAENHKGHTRGKVVLRT